MTTRLNTTLPAKMIGIKSIYALLIIGLASFILLMYSCHSKSDPTAATFTALPGEFELEGITIDELPRKMESGAYTVRQITELYLDHIKKIDKNGPTLNAIIEINPDALSIADSLDKTWAIQKVMGTYTKCRWASPF